MENNINNPGTPHGQENPHYGAGQPVPAGGPPYGPSFVPPAPAKAAREKHREPFAATKADGFFAMACLLLGVLFYRTMWFYYTWQGWGIGLFTLCYVVAMLLYARGKGLQPAKASWYWLGILALTAASYALWPSATLEETRDLFLFEVALYWVGSLFCVQVGKGTGNFMPLDGINLTLILPLRNFFVGIYSLKAFAATTVGQSERHNKGSRTVLYALLGVGLCIPVFAAVLPMLLAADGGGFTDLTRNVLVGLEKWLTKLNLLDIWQYIFGGLVALYICGLGAGAAHKRYTGTFDTKKIQKWAGAARLLPDVSGLVLLGVVSLLYLVFVFCQVPYFFSAFGGALPKGFVYAEYARQGFFELCRIAVFNMALLAGVNCFCRTRTAQALPLRALNLVMVALNLLLIATAFSKMAMYIDVYGLTPKRLLTSVFMVFMAVVWTGVAVLQFRYFSIVRLAALVGSLMFCALCLCNADGLILRYNAGRYMAGTLEEFDMTIVGYMSTQSEAGTLLEVYHFTGDEKLQKSIANRLDRYSENAENVRGTERDTLAHAKVRALEWPLEGEATE